MKHILLAGAAFAALTSASLAADIAVEPVDIWSGYYAGLQGGYAWGDQDTYWNGAAVPYTYDVDGGFGGLYYGRNWQSGNWVFGLDGSISFSDIKGSVTDGATIETTIQGFSASRVRAGYAFDNVLVFAAAGFSLARFEGEVLNTPAKDDGWAAGFTLGAGIEAKIAANWSARLEYLYIDYGKETLDFFPAEADFDFENVHAVRAGVAYHF